MTRSQRRLPSESMGIMDERASGQRAGRGAGPAHSKPGRLQSHNNVMYEVRTLA